MLAQRGDFLAKFDLEKAYWHIRLSDKSRQFGTIYFQNKIWYFNCMAFGLSIAPRLFTKHLQPVIEHLRHDHLMRLMVYLDDIVVLGRDPNQLRSEAELICQLLENLGWSIARDKCILEPSQSVEALGYIINTALMVASISERKIARLLGRLRETLVLASSGRLTLRQLAHILGSIQSNRYAIYNIGAKVLELQHVLRSATQQTAEWDSSVVLSPEAFQEIRQWQQKIHVWNGRSFLAFKADITITTDASETGWGAHVHSPPVLHPSAKGVWSAEESKLHINELEILAVANGLRAHVTANNWSHCQILLGIDNMRALSYLLRSSGKVLRLARLIRDLVFWAEDRHLQLHGNFVASRDNVAADKLSRESRDLTDWRLHPSVFSEICTIFGSPAVDLFASAANALLPRFVSYTPQPGALRVDALSPFFNWADFDLCFINPPFAIIDRVLEKLSAERGNAILIVPFWLSAHWWPILVLLLSGFPVWLPGWALSFQSTPSASVSHPRWRTLCCQVSGLNSSRWDSSVRRQPSSSPYSSQAHWKHIVLHGSGGGGTR